VDSAFLSTVVALLARSTNVAAYLLTYLLTLRDGKYEYQLSRTLNRDSGCGR